MDRIEAVKVVSRLPESRDPWLALIGAIGIIYIYIYMIESVVFGVSTTFALP